MPPGTKAGVFIIKHRNAWGIILMGMVFFMIGRLFRLNPSFSAALYHENVSTKVLCNGSHSEGRYAYVFYASDDAYACSALVNMARLKKTLPEDVDLIMVAFESVSSAIRDVAVHRLGGLVYDTSSFGMEYDMGAPIGQYLHYRHCFLKFLAFLLPNDKYRRLIMLDSDSLILRAPHHLFHLPDELPLAVPSAYWLRPQFVGVTNWLMSVMCRENLRRANGRGEER